MPRRSSARTKRELVKLRLRVGLAYLIKPIGKVDPQKRWVWGFPFWLTINDGFGHVAHRHYVAKLLAAGFHVAGVDGGPADGSVLGGQAEIVLLRGLGDERTNSRGHDGPELYESSALLKFLLAACRGCIGWLADRLVLWCPLVAGP